MLLNERRPVIVLIDPSHIYGGVGGFGHFIVIVGFKDGEIKYHDPDEPDGQNRKGVICTKKYMKLQKNIL